MTRVTPHPVESQGATRVAKGRPEQATAPSGGSEPHGVGSVGATSYGASERPPRGDYARGGQVQADYTCPQNYAAYLDADHETYRRLYERQTALLPGLACDEFIAALPSLGAKHRIPRFEEINEPLFKASSWKSWRCRG